MWLHSPQTTHQSLIQRAMAQRKTTNALSGQSSPGILHDGQHPSYGTRQIPHTSPSSSGSLFPVFQRHCATALQCLMWTFIGGWQLGYLLAAGSPLSWLAGHEGGRISSLALQNDVCLALCTRLVVHVINVLCTDGASQGATNYFEPGTKKEKGFQ